MTSDTRWIVLFVALTLLLGLNAWDHGAINNNIEASQCNDK